MTAKHTPGPWLHEVGPDAPIGSVVTFGGDPIASTCANALVPGSNGSRAQHEMRNANARLIAAAPELLEALIALVERRFEVAKKLGVSRKEALGSDGRYQKALAAILKATGEAS